MIFFCALFVLVKLAILNVVGLILLPLIFIPLVALHISGRRLWKVEQGGHLVLWLRRFGRNDLRKFPFGKILSQASGDYATPLTIQDSTYRFSFDFLISKGVGVILFIMIFGFIGGLVISLLIAFAWDGLGRVIGLGDWWNLLILPITIPIVFGLPIYLVRRACFQRLKASNARRKIEELSDQVRLGRRSNALHIARCGDSFWRDAVQTGIERASAVVIDVTAVGRNIRWELSQVKALVPPERVILVAAAQHGEPFLGRMRLGKELEDVFGISWLMRTRKILYEVPDQHPAIIEFFMQRLREFVPILFKDSREFGADLASHLVACLDRPANLRVVRSESNHSLSSR